MFSVAGTLIWAGSLLALGAFFGDELHRLAEALAPYGALAVAALLLALVGYLGLKLLERQRVLRKLRVDRISAEELFERQERGDALTIIDLRSGFDVEFDPALVRGATLIPYEDIDARHEEIPRDREVVVYCT